MSIFIHQRQAQFAESDAAGVIHFSSFPRYVEEAEHKYLETIGHPIQVGKSGSLLWPRIEYSAKFARPLLPMEQFEVVLSVKRFGRSSITWNWLIRRKDGLDKLAEGEMKTVCCVARKGKVESIDIPSEIREKLNELY